MGENETSNGQAIPPKVDLRKQMPPRPAEPPPPAKSLMQTTQIEIEDLQPAAKVSAPVQAGKAARPTVVMRPATPPPSEATRMETMQIEAADFAAETKRGLPAAAPGARVADGRRAPSATVPVIPVGAPPGKRETSRIPLEMAKPTLGSVPTRPPSREAAPSTIRVKPVVVRQTVDLAQAAPDRSASVPAAGAPAAGPVVTPPLDVGKRKTARISLEAALGEPSPAAPAPVAPAGGDEQRTIRLRRPAEGLAKKTVSITDIGSDAEGAGTAAADGGPSPTRKKTIKVRRPGKGVEGGAPAEAARPVPTMAAAVEAVENRPHLFFGWAAGLGVAVCLVVVYVLMAQAFGPNLSLTTLSYGWPDFDVSWPGKISR